MDKWELRAKKKRLARQKQLRKRMLIGGGILVLAIIIIIAVAAAHSKTASAKKAVSRTESSQEASVPGASESDTENMSSSSDASSEETPVDSSSVIAPDTVDESSNSREDSPEAQTQDPLTPTVSTISTDAAPDGSGLEVNEGRTDWNFQDSSEKIVYLTFDDGPSSLTPQILDILDQFGIKATFFVTGQCPEYFDYIKDAFNRGHTIGLHTYSHDYEQIYTSADAYLNDLNAIGEVVRNEIGYVPCFIRFPGGSSNESSASYCSGIMTALSSIVQSRGFQYQDWNASTGDGENVTADEEIENALDLTECGNAVVLLAHDGGGKQATVKALPTIIRNYLNLGYTFKALDRSSTIVHHQIFN